MLKKKTNKKVIAISVLAVLLVALIAFNLTYAYFTDKTSGSGEVQFGIVDINLTGVEGGVFSYASTTSFAMPGDTVSLKGTLKVSDETNADDVYLNFVVSNIVVKYAGVAIVGGTTANVYFDNDAVDGSGYTYTSGDITAMETQFTDILVDGLTGALNDAGITGVTFAAVDGADASLGCYTTTAVNQGTSIDLSDVSFSLAIGEFGNLWQNCSVSFDLTINALQSRNIANGDAAKAIFATLDGSEVGDVNINTGKAIAE